MNSVVKIIGLSLAIAIGFAFIKAFFVELLWNYFCSAINCNPIGYWQAWAMCLFVSLLFAKTATTKE